MGDPKYPLELFQRPIRWHTAPGELCLEPFAGSGTCLIAAAMEGRRCYAVELSPAFCDAIRKRWGDYARSAGLDPGETAALNEVLRALPDRGTTVLLVEHDMSVVLEVCDRVDVIDFGGLIASGTPAEVRADGRVIAAYLGDGIER